MCYFCEMAAIKRSRGIPSVGIPDEVLDVLARMMNSPMPDPSGALGSAPAGDSVDATLGERGNRYGEFETHAAISQNIKEAMRNSPNWEALPAYMKESLEMNTHKVARILNGDPFYADSWHDIGGYTRLVENIISRSKGGV